MSSRWLGSQSLQGDDNGSEGDDESDGQSNDVSESDYEMDGNTSNLDDLEFDHNVYSTVEFRGVQENEQVGFVTEPNEVQGEVDQVEEDQVEQGHVEPDPIQIEVHVEPDPVQTEAQVTEPDQVLFEPQEVQVQPPPSQKKNQDANFKLKESTEPDLLM
nr:uncharacterized protein LOC109191245 [Ipomoea batatas]